ncbi:MAG: HEPN domain-containing protein [Acetobacter aceti]|uniref:HEPN domain-containing protein n=1 Tax=Acetobacter aceti TaxID=435 RepID=UPI0011EA5B75|nr:HEPN domain-containing protein [Acetobacter aceti]
MSQSLCDFSNQVKTVDQLINIHRNLRSGRGRRYEQDALYKAGVVMIVACWQAYIENITQEALNIIERSINNPQALPPTWAVQIFNSKKSEIRNAIKKFNTPDDVRVRDLLSNSFDFNPWLNWAWRSGPRQWTEKQTRSRTNQWLQVRHSVAHGFSLPSDIPWIQGNNNVPRLTLNLLEECKKHFVFLANKTDSGFQTHLIARYLIANPW